MSYIDKNLLPEEQILFRTKKHYIIFLVPVIWVIATFFFLFNPNDYVVKLFFAPLLAAILTGANQALTYITSDFVITNKRVMMTEGFFFRHSNELRLSSISNISVTQSLLAQFLHYGTVVINPFGGNQDVFSEIANPFEFQKQANLQLDKISKYTSTPNTPLYPK